MNCLNWPLLHPNPFRALWAYGDWPPLAGSASGPLSLPPAPDSKKPVHLCQIISCVAWPQEGDSQGGLATSRWQPGMIGMGHCVSWYQCGWDQEEETVLFLSKHRVCAGFMSWQRTETIRPGVKPFDTKLTYQRLLTNLSWQSKFTLCVNGLHHAASELLICSVEHCHDLIFCVIRLLCHITGLSEVWLLSLEAQGSPWQWCWSHLPRQSQQYSLTTRAYQVWHRYCGPPALRHTPSTRVDGPGSQPPGQHQSPCSRQPSCLPTIPELTDFILKA